MKDFSSEKLGEYLDGPMKFYLVNITHKTIIYVTTTTIMSPLLIQIHILKKNLKIPLILILRLTKMKLISVITRISYTKEKISFQELLQEEHVKVNDNATTQVKKITS